MFIQKFNNMFNTFSTMAFFLLLINRILRCVATDETNLAETIRCLREKLGSIYKQYEADLTPNIRPIFETERQTFFNGLDKLTNKQFNVMERLEKKWTKLETIFLIDSPEQISELVNRLDSEKRAELSKFGQKPENTDKLLKHLATVNSAKFELLILTLYDALKGTERAEYAKHVQRQSKAIHVYSIYMKYAKEKVDSILGKDSVHCEAIAKYDKKFEKFLEIMVTKFSRESQEKLAEFVVDLVQTCRISTSYRQKAGSLVVDYKSHYKKILRKNVALIFARKYSVEHFVEELCHTVAAHSDAFLQKWVSHGKFGTFYFCRYRAFIWRQILDKLLKNEEQIELDKFVDKMFGQRQIFEMEKYDHNFVQLVELVRRVKSREDTVMQFVMEIPEIKVAILRLFSFRHFLSEIKAMEKKIREIGN